MNPRTTVRVALVSFLCAFIGSSAAEEIEVPNGSFEAPAVAFVTVELSDWRRAPKPDGYVEGGGFLWDQLAGIFKNPPAGSADHIDNCNGAQAAWLFAVPEVAVFQDYAQGAEEGPKTTDLRGARFEVGKAYELTVGVIGGAGGMREGVTLELGLYYRDGASNQVIVAASTVTNTPSVFSSTTHFVDQMARLSTVRSDSPWAGKPIGVRLLSTVSAELAGGYWDIDQVRLRSRRPPILRGPSLVELRFGFTLQGEPGTEWEVLSSADPTAPPQEWSRVGVLAVPIGEAVFLDTNVTATARFYGVRELR